MKETVFSMRVYLILVGSIATLGSLAQIVKAKASLLALIPAMNLLLAFGCLYVGFRLPKLLHDSPRTMRRFFVAAAVWLGFQLLLSLLGARMTLGPIVALLVIWYLFKNASRLSIELHKPEPPTSTN
jgi:hypothetical protein